MSPVRRPRTQLRSLLDRPAVARQCNICWKRFNPLKMPGDSWLCPVCGPKECIGPIHPGCTACDPRFDLCPVGQEGPLVDKGRPRRPVPASSAPSWAGVWLPRWAKALRVVITERVPFLT